MTTRIETMDGGDGQQVGAIVVEVPDREDRHYLFVSFDDQTNKWHDRCVLLEMIVTDWMVRLPKDSSFKCGSNGRYDIVVLGCDIGFMADTFGVVLWDSDEITNVSKW